MHNVELTIVICNFNKKAFLQGCLDSIFASTLNSDFFSVIVVDNASTDGSVDMIKTEYTNRVRLISMPKNTGGAGGFSQGIEAAMQTQTDFIALLDNDILLDSSTLLTLLNYLKDKPDVGVVGAKICVMDKPNTLQELGSFIDWKSFNVSTPLKGYLDTEKLPEIVECDYVPACCFITKRAVVEKVGSFDKRHFIYWDDMDWCTRVKAAGFAVHAMRDARVLHKMGAVNTSNTFSNYYFERNRILYFIKHSSLETFNRFCRKFVSQLQQQCFFAHRKGLSNNVISTLLGMIDIVAGQLFEQPKHILDKQDVEPLAALKVEEHDSVCVILCDDVLTNKRVINAILHSSTLLVYVVAHGPSDIQVDDERLRFSDQKPQSTALTVHIVPHIIEAKLSASNVGEFAIDGFLNLCQVDSLAELQRDYSNYQQFFGSILRPVFERQLLNAYERYHAERWA
jgi:GT2 family glycosyltransferase